VLYEHNVKELLKFKVKEYESLEPTHICEYDTIIIKGSIIGILHVLEIDIGNDPIGIANEYINK